MRVRLSVNSRSRNTQNGVCQQCLKEFHILYVCSNCGRRNCKDHRQSIFHKCLSFEKELKQTTNSNPDENEFALAQDIIPNKQFTTERRDFLVISVLCIIAAIGAFLLLRI